MSGGYQPRAAAPGAHGNPPTGGSGATPPPPIRIEVSTPTLSLPKLSYSVDEAAEATSFSSTTLWDAIAKGELAAKKRGRRTYILVNELVRWLEAGDDVETRQ